jgi:Ca2+-binding RTX toxin-like protein
MGLFNEVENFLNQKDVWTPGFGNDFDHSLADKSWDFLNEFPDNFKNDLPAVKNWLDDFVSSRDFENNDLTLKNPFTEKYSISIKEGDSSTILANSGLVVGTLHYIDANGNVVLAGDAMTIIQDDNGNIFTIIKDNVYTPLKDGTLATVNTVIETLQSAQATAENFINGYMGQINNLFTTPEGIAGLISDVATGIQRGDSPEEIAKFVATKLAVKQLLQQGSAAIKQQIQELLAGNAADQAAIESGNLLNLSQEGAAKLQGLESITNSVAFNYGYMVVIAYATTLLLNMNEGWDREEYTQAAVQSAAQVAAQMVVVHYFGSSASASGVGAAVAYMVSAGINDLYADDHMNSHQWQSAVVSAAVIGVAAAIGWALGGPVGAVVATIIVSQFMGGKEYGPGEYPNPYSYLDLTPKEDGTGNIIRGIEPEGVVAIAREYFHDDIYGTRGSDNLIGKSGTNTIMGYEGNDHLEGRGDVDLLIGGKGDDEVFGGNGNDQIYGSEGNDNLFGGNGDDVIVGDTGSPIVGSEQEAVGSNNDFIQGGNGDDQIMGEYGNDTIQGNTGDDIILGGQGNDRMEGGEGDDSILGEDGDDIIIGDSGQEAGGSGAGGNDIIDGGAGIDIIYGNAGNDNIRGGDDNDEIYGNEGVDIIYGDSGNDLINAGADNDLVFGGISNDIIYGADGDDTLSGEIGNDYLIGAEGDDTIDGGANDDVILGGTGDDIITTGEGNDTIIYRLGDGNDVIQEAVNSGQGTGNDVLRLSAINSKLSNNTTNKVVLTKSGNDLLIQIKDDTNNIISDNSITVKDQFLNQTQILKKIEFADGKYIDLTNITIPPSDGEISLTTYDLRLKTNIDTAILHNDNFANCNFINELARSRL